MSTLHTMNLALVDIEARLTRELQFSADAEKQILDNLNTVHEGLDQLDRSIRAAFTERTRALSAAIGSGNLQVTSSALEGEPKIGSEIVSEGPAAPLKVTRPKAA